MIAPMRDRRGHGGHDRGAAAVEFALVVPLLLLLVFGIIDYGRFFFDSVSLRQGAREGARQAVVQIYGGKQAGTGALCNTLGTVGAVGAKIACSAKAASDITIGIPWVYIPAITPTTTPKNWVLGKQLLVCMLSLEKGTGLVPFPAGGILKTKTYMSIEVDSTQVDPFYAADILPTGLPAGSDWTSWCY